MSVLTLASSGIDQRESILKSVSFVRSASIVAYILQTTYLSAFVMSYTVNTIYYLPILWSISCSVMTMNFIRNRRYVNAKKESLIHSMSQHSCCHLLSRESGPLLEREIVSITKQRSKSSKSAKSPINTESQTGTKSSNHESDTMRSHSIPPLIMIHRAQTAPISHQISVIVTDDNDSCVSLCNIISVALCANLYHF